MKPEVIQKLRNDAHEIALKRRKEWWDAMTPAEQKIASRGILEAEIGESEHLAEFKPGVIELDPDYPPTPYAVQMQLMLLNVFVSLDDLATQPTDELEAASLWATTTMLAASDNDVMIAPRPQWLPARDSATALELCKADILAHGGEAEAERVYHTEWHTDDLGETPEEDHDDEPEWAQRLRRIADTLISADIGIEDAEWLNAWLEAGAPTLESVHDHDDTRVVVEIPEMESQDGNASTT